MTRLAVVATALVLLVAVLLGLLWTVQRRLVYLPGRGPLPPVEAVLPGAREVVLRTADGLRLGGWYLPSAEPQAPAVLVASGNAGSRDLRAPLARSLGQHGLSVLLFDYRGYAGNPGSPSERGLALDVRAARRFLRDEGVPQDRLFYVGESLGAAVVTELATEHPPAGLVLRSPFVDLASVGELHYPFLPVRRLLRDRFPVREQVAEVRAPTTVVHGSADRVVPADQSRRVAAAARHLHRSVEVPGADHNDPVLTSGRPVVGAVLELVQRAGQPPGRDGG